MNDRSIVSANDAVSRPLSPAKQAALWAKGRASGEQVTLATYPGSGSRTPQPWAPRKCRLRGASGVRAGRTCPVRLANAEQATFEAKRRAGAARSPATARDSLCRAHQHEGTPVIPPQRHARRVTQYWVQKRVTAITRQRADSASALRCYRTGEEKAESRNWLT